MVSIYPNLGFGVFNISSSNFTNSVEIKVTDLLGKVVLNRQVDASSISTINLENQSKGMYIFNLKSGDLRQLKN